MERRGRGRELRARHAGKHLGGAAVRDLRCRGILRLSGYQAPDQADGGRYAPDRVAGERRLVDRTQPRGRRRSRGRPPLRTGTELPLAVVLRGGGRAGAGSPGGTRRDDGRPARRRAALAPGLRLGQLPRPSPRREPGSLRLTLREADRHHGRPAPVLRRKGPAVCELLGLGAALPAGCAFRTCYPGSPEQPVEPVGDGGGYERARTHGRSLPGAGHGSGLAGLGPLFVRANARRPVRRPGGRRVQEAPLRRRTRQGTRRFLAPATPRRFAGRVAFQHARLKRACQPGRARFVAPGRSTELLWVSRFAWRCLSESQTVVSREAGDLYGASVLTSR